MANRVTFSNRITDSDKPWVCIAMRQNHSCTDVGGTTLDLATFAFRHSDGKEQFGQVMTAMRDSLDIVVLGKDGAIKNGSPAATWSRYRVGLIVAGQDFEAERAAFPGTDNHRRYYPCRK